MKECLSEAVRRGLWASTRAPGDLSAVAKGGFRAFLGLPERNPEPKLTELAEDPPPTPTRPVARLDRNVETAPLQPASLDKTAPISAVAAEEKNDPQPRRSSAGVWRSQRTKETRAGWADYIDRPF
jgi:hypothetical protein